MIIPTKTGICVIGTLGKDAELRNVGSKNVLKMSVQYAREPAVQQGGRRTVKYLDVDLWNDAENLDAMLHKGDVIAAVGEEIKTREYNGKNYYSMDAQTIIPSASVVFRWMQQVVEMIPMSECAPTPVPVDEPTPFDEPQSEPQQTTLQEAMPTRSLPHADPIAQAAKDGLIDDTADDLLF
jgi:single-stranded DNA-binding protein